MPMNIIAIFAAVLLEVFMVYRVVVEYDRRETWIT